jgi:hypothetical protein
MRRSVYALDGAREAVRQRKGARSWPGNDSGRDGGKMALGRDARYPWELFFFLIRRL